MLTRPVPITGCRRSARISTSRRRPRRVRPSNVASGPPRKQCVFRGPPPRRRCTGHRVRGFQDRTSTQNGGKGGLRNTFVDKKKPLEFAGRGQNPKNVRTLYMDYPSHNTPQDLSSFYSLVQASRKLTSASRTILLRSWHIELLDHYSRKKMDKTAAAVM